MRRLVAVTLFTLAPLMLHAQVTSEGRVQDATPPALDAARVSKYSSAPTGSGMPETASVQEKSASATAGTKVYRPDALSLSPRAAYFSIYDAGRALTTDRDGDGYHSEFRIRFDADVSIGDALVYAKLYIRRVGDTGGWRLYHTTNDFWIYGLSGTDDYYVDTTLNDGFPTAEYDVLIDLYESGYSGIVATIDAYNTSALGYLPLEEAGLDLPFGLAGYYINDVATTFLIDDDRDGYYSRFRVTFDPDTDFGDSWVYAVVWVRPQGGAWIREHESADFQIDASGTADAYSFTADWISGYPTARYDVQIDLHDAATGLLVASAGSERPELSRLALEDQARDRYVSPPNGGSSGSTTSNEHGGGALSIWLAVALAMLAIGRKLQSIKKLRAAVALRARSRESAPPYQLPKR